MEQTNGTTSHKTGSVVAGEQTYTGGCHCGAGRFEATIDLSAPVSRCNCSICTKVAPSTAIVKPSAFRLLSGQGALARYQWGGKTGTRCFCQHCGVHCSGPGHLEMLGGDFVSINVNALDGVDPSALRVIYFDGRHDNWQSGPRETAWPIA